ncbi:MAG TPA: hypothetical protein VI391_09355, partial [Thermoanaerobaculia bacterium]
MKPLRNDGHFRPLHQKKNDRKVQPDWTDQDGDTHRDAADAGPLTQQHRQRGAEKCEHQDVGHDLVRKEQQRGGNADQQTGDDPCRAIDAPRGETLHGGGERHGDQMLNENRRPQPAAENEDDGEEERIAGRAERLRHRRTDRKQAGRRRVRDEIGRVETMRAEERMCERD